MKYTTETFIEKARKVHNDRYTYEKVNYVDSKTKVIITCPKHGDYEQLPTVHLSGGKCMECSFDDKRKSRLTTDDIIERFKKTHGDKYDYSKVNYVNPDTKVTIVCPKHGEFEQLPFNHINDQGCPRCHGMYKTQDEIIDRFHKVHGDKYDYSKVNFTKTKTKVCITCPIHGEFWQTPEKHLNGQGCPKCGGTKRLTNDEFITLSKKVHDDEYDYSKVEYKSMSKKVCLTHKKCGRTFWQVASYHIKGAGCPFCFGTTKLTLNEFIERANKVHNNKYDYAKSIYKNIDTKLTIICPKHGKFEQIPYNHLIGQGCPKCANETNAINKTSNTEEFIEKARKIHGDKYGYSKVNYIGYKDKIEIICPKHGTFLQSPNAHLNGCGCSACGNELTTSKSEKEIQDFVKSITNEKILFNNRSVLTPLELDVYIPNNKVAIEFDGIYWHSDEFIKDSNYHLNKTLECAKQGIQLIHIFEDEWLEKQNIVKSRIKNTLGLTENTLYARKCDVREIPYKLCEEFLNKNHLQGNVMSKHRYGLYYQDELVSLMTFGKRRKNMGATSEDGEFELLRFCSKLDTNVIGAASKLLKYFIETIKPTKITTYADRRWSEGEMYKQLGFTLSHSSKPNYFYVIGLTRENRFKYRKSELIKEGYDPDKSERDIMNERGIYRIYDCGSNVFEMMF